MRRNGHRGVGHPFPTCTVADIALCNLPKLDHLVGHYSRVKSDATLEQASESLRRKVAGIKEPISYVLNLDKLPAEDELRSEYIFILRNLKC